MSVADDSARQRLAVLEERMKRAEAEIAALVATIHALADEIKQLTMGPNGTGLLP